MPYIIPLFIHFRHTPGVPMSETPNAHWGTGASVRVEFRDRSCAYGSLPDAPDSIAGRGKAKPLWLHRSEDVEREEWRYAWRVPLALPPAQMEGGWLNSGGLHRCGIAIPGPFGPPNAPRSRNRLAFETAGGASPVSRQRRDLRPGQGWKSHCRDGGNSQASASPISSSLKMRSSISFRSSAIFGMNSI